MDLSLDDFIKQKYSKVPNRDRGRQSFSDRRRPRQQRTSVQRAGRSRGPMLDARMKIIQKSRSRIVDARDKLAEIAKQTDARVRLEKLRNTRHKEDIDDDDVIFVSRRPADMVQNSRAMRDVFAPLSRELTIVRDHAPRITKQKAEIIDVSPAMIRRTVKNDPPVSRPPPQPAMYSWKVPSYSVGAPTVSQKSGSIMSERPEWRNQTTAGLKKVAVPSAASKEPRYQKADGRLSLQTKIRLDGRENTGHRIVVSNLQPTVTDEDIRELFEDIGDLLSSHLIRPGTAEVVYRSHKDAVKAVDVYHNRQLDGQPMKCFLVNSTGSGSKSPAPAKLTVVPSIDTIHKVLFNKS